MQCQHYVWPAAWRKAPDGAYMKASFLWLQPQLLAVSVAAFHELGIGIHTRQLHWQALDMMQVVVGAKC
jgi:hypothetical protein